MVLGDASVALGLLLPALITLESPSLAAVIEKVFARPTALGLAAGISVVRISLENSAGLFRVAAGRKPGAKAVVLPSCEARG